MENPASWALLLLGFAGLLLAAALGFHFFRHRDRRHGDRRQTSRRDRGQARASAIEDRRERRDRRARERRSGD